MPYGLSLSVAKDLLLAFCSLPFACSSVTLHLSGHGSIFPLLFLCCCFHAISVMAFHWQTPVALLQQVLLATGVRISPSPPRSSYLWDVVLGLGEPMLVWKGCPEEDAHLEPSHCICSQLATGKSLPFPLSQLCFFLFPKK